MTPRTTHLPRFVPFAGMALLMLLAPAAQASAQALTSEIAVANTILETEVIRGQSGTFTFEVENKGIGPLEILNVQTSCDCARIDHPGTIEAKGKGPVKATVDTTRVSGGITVDIVLTTNDPQTPMQRLTAKLTVREILAAVSGSLRYLVHQNFAESGTLDQVVLSTDNQDFNIVDIKSPYPHLTITKPREAREDERIGDFTSSQWVFTATLERDAPVGALRGELMITTDHPTQKYLPVPISGFVRPVIVYTPNVLNLGAAVIPEEGGFLTLHMKQFAEDPIEIESIEVDSEHIVISHQTLEDGREWRLRANLLPTLPTGSLNATVTVKTSSEFAPVTKVPIRGRVLPAESSDGSGRSNL